MKHGRSYLKIAYSVLTMLALTASLSTATYAWFSSNSIVSTDRVTGHSATEQVELQLSSTGGNGFRGGEEAAITQVNTYDGKLLQPVSTSNLQNFVYNAKLVNGVASTFETVENEKYIYHGVVYLKAVGENQPANARMALYLDEDVAQGGKLVQNITNATQSGERMVMNAARLGLRFDNGAPLILKLSDGSNPADSREANTSVNGQMVGEGYVLSSANGQVNAVADPAVLYTKYVLNEDGNLSGTTPLLYMELNRIYALDIFFYLEGCDPDCVDVIRFDQFDLHLGFYGVLTEEAG